MRLVEPNTDAGIGHAIATATAGDIPTAIAGRRRLTVERIATATVIATAARIVEERGHE
jgi:hypothetical protein